MLRKANVSEIYQIKCKYFDSGYCKFRNTGCSFFYPEVVCLRTFCENNKRCLKRHPRKCRYEMKCIYLNNCSYRHIGQKVVNKGSENGKKEDKALREVMVAL